MPTYYARKAGNINAADVWATAPAGTASAVTFAAGDVLMANSFAITINVDTNLGASGQVRNDTLGGATAGGTFTLNSGITLTANAIAGSAASACVTFSAAAPAVANFVGNANAGTIGSADAIIISASGTLNITSGLITGGTTTTARGVFVSGGGQANITGNIIGGNGGEGLRVTLGNAQVIGNITGGSTGTSYGARNFTGNAGSIVVTGQAIASAASTAILNSTAATISVTRAVGNGYGPGSVNQSLVPAVDNAVQGSITIVQELEWGALGAPPTNGAIRLAPASTNIARFYTGTGVKTLVDATQGQMPAATDVRSGVSYASGALTGSCAVPAAGSVSMGVPVDAGFGTAVLTTADVQSALTAQGLTTARAGALDNLDASVSSRLAPNGTLATVTTLTNAPDVPTEAEIASAVWSAASREITGGTVDTLTNAPASVTPSDIWSHAARTITGGTVDTLTNAPTVPSAASIRAEIDSNSTQLAAIKAKTDLLPASPAATGDIPTADITAIKGKTDLLETTRLAQCSTVATTGAQLAAALS
jgi:hypothetical protein